jgi:hypothetical protein
METFQNLDKTTFDGKMASMPYGGCEAVTLTSTDYTVTSSPARGAIVTSSGNVVLQFYDGSQATIPVFVAASNFVELRGYLISKIIRSGTTATVSYVLL